MSSESSSVTTFYPGVGADEEMARLRDLVGEIIALWAGIEDGLFDVFAAALTDNPVNLATFRAVFFTFSSYEGKMRMTNNALKERLSAHPTILQQWRDLKKRLDAAASIRNEIAHLIPQALSTTDPKAPANVRLIPAFWKTWTEADFEKLGYSYDQLVYAWAPYCGYHPRVHHPEAHEQLAYSVHQFAKAVRAIPLTPPVVP